MPSTRYARFFKCDLQLQTPADGGHWQGRKLASNPSDTEIAAAADDYVAACHEAGLEVVAITDHNAGDERGLVFLDALQEANKRRKGSHQEWLHIFPGFEIGANAGGHVHFLCLFDPDTTSETLSHTLTMLGLSPEDRKPGKNSDKNLDELLRIVQDERGGIVIAAHVDRSNGACDDKKIEAAWQVETIRNEKLLAIELSRPRECYNERRPGDIVHNRGDFERRHPIAVVNSSDNKRLRSDDGKGDGKAIGDRYTWIRMSQPSVEGLRQAFLDHESRIRFGEKRPEETLTHPRIERIKVTGDGPLAGFEIELPPGLTSLIGGGGTGKSTLVEAVRAATTEPPTNREAQQLHQKAIEFLDDVTVSFETRTGDDQHALELRHGVAIEDHSGFPIVALSQREAFAIATDPRALAGLIDTFAGNRLESAEYDAADAAAKVLSLSDQLSALPELEARRTVLNVQIERLASEVTAAENRAEPLRERNLHLREERVVSKIDRRLEEIAGLIENAAASLEFDLSAGDVRDPDTPHADAVGDLIDRTRAAVDEAAKQLVQAAAGLRAFGQREVSRSERQGWEADRTAAVKAFEIAFEGATLGASEDAASQLSDNRDQLHDIEEKISGLQSLRGEFEEAIDDLSACWKREAGERLEVAKLIAAGMITIGDSGQPFVTVDIEPFTDLTILIEKMSELVDSRSMRDDEVVLFCGVAAAKADDSALVGQSIVDMVNRVAAGEEVPEIDLSTATRKMLAARAETIRRAILTLRPVDRVDVAVFDAAGNQLGTLERGLSVGQRCAAILALVLSLGDKPVVIDQPEDEIDNEFIYSELVPLIRKAKERRQVIVSTHNPNIPVNGDAELIVALAARAEKDAPTTAVSVSGSLDMKDVQFAVGSIMEGSEEAFERRRLRYGF